MKKNFSQKLSVSSKEHSKVTYVTTINYVIDASIAGINDLRVILDNILNSTSKIILTSTTIKELNELQRFQDSCGEDASYILSLATKRDDKFVCVLIDETHGTPNDCIVKYCADNSRNTILLTANKSMSLKARSFGVLTFCYE